MSRLVLATMNYIPDQFSAPSRVPKQIVLKGDLLKAFIKLIPYFEALDRWEGHKPSYTLSAERLFDGDEGVWEMFAHLFFPHLTPTFRVVNDPESPVQFFNVFEYNTGTHDFILGDAFPREDVYALLDYFLITPERRYDMIRELKDLHHWWFRIHVEQPFTRIHAPNLRSGYNANLSLTPNVNENNMPPVVNNYNELNGTYNGNNEGNDPYNKLTITNYRRFVGPVPKSSKRKTKKKRATK